MSTVSSTNRLLTIARLIVTAFIPWYFLDRPMKILDSFIGHFKAFVEICGFVFLLKTLIRPWKGIIEEYPKMGAADMHKILHVLSMNFISRVIGVVIRTCSIIIGLAILLVVTLAFSIYFLVWITFPFLFVFGVYSLSTALF